MQLGMIGLGRMGAGMVRRLMRGGHACVVYDRAAAAVAALVADGATGSASLAEFVGKLQKPRALCLMVPAAKVKPQARAEEVEITESEADTVPYEGEILVFDDLVRDELLLETPMIPLCSEDCPGMREAASAKGANDEERDSRDSIDPRLSTGRAASIRLTNAR